MTPSLAITLATSFEDMPNITVETKTLRNIDTRILIHPGYKSSLCAEPGIA